MRRLSNAGLSIMGFLVLSTSCWGAVIFEDNFDSHPDWYGTAYECMVWNCPTAPAGWSGYRVGNDTVGNKTLQINGSTTTDHTTGSGKALIHWQESSTQGYWGSDGILAKLLASNSQELYIRAWLKFQPGFAWGGDQLMKHFRVSNYDQARDAAKNGGTPNNFQMSTNGGHDGLLFYDTSHQTGLFLSFRCSPGSTNYYCSPDYDHTYTASVNPTDGNWHRYDWHVKRNTKSGGVCQSNGVMEFWIDGNLTASLTSLKWPEQSSCSDTVDRGWNYVSLGGNVDNLTGSGLPEQWLAFDDFVISTTPIPANYVIGGGGGGGGTPATPNPPTGLRIN